MSNELNKISWSQETQSEFLFNYKREAIRNWMALHFDELEWGVSIPQRMD
jgi:hypothetical protein